MYKTHPHERLVVCLTHLQGCVFFVLRYYVKKAHHRRNPRREDYVVGADVEQIHYSPQNFLKVQIIRWSSTRFLYTVCNTLLLLLN